MLLVDL